MSLLSSVTGAASSLLGGFAPLITGHLPTGLLGGVLSGLTSSRKPDALTATLAAAATRTKAKPKAKATAKAGTSKKTATKAPTKAPAAKTRSPTATKAATAAGYSKTAATDDFAFLKDPALSVEEKLFRFMCATAKRNDDEVLKKMEEMKGGAPAAAPKTGTSGGTTAAGGSKPGATTTPGGVNVWGAMKALIPPLGLAAQVVGDAKLKSTVAQLSGPVLAAAATAAGLPTLAPLAMKAGPELTSSLLDGKLGGGDAGGPVGGRPATGPSTSGGGSTRSPTATTAAASGKNEQVGMMELQRLIDKQKEMFTMISNVLNSQHQTRMSIIGNVR